MNALTWPTLARAAAWLMAGAFVLASVLLLLLGFQVFGGPPEPAGVFLDDVLAGFAWEQTQWPIEFAGSALFVIGFLALGVLGPVFSRLAGSADARGGLVSVAFLLSAGLGATSQLIYIGAKPIATSPQYCECGLLAEEIMSRLMTLNIVNGIQTWLVSGAMLAATVGLLAAGQLGRDAGMPAAWRTLAWVAAALALIVAILPLFDLAPFDVLLVVLVAGLLIPIWAVWFASRVDDLWAPALSAPSIAGEDPLRDR